MNARCDNDHCKELKYQEPEEAMKCTVPQTMVEDVEGNDCKLIPMKMGQWLTFFDRASIATGRCDA